MNDTREVYSCSNCNKICKDARGLSIHESRCGKNKNIECSYCNKTFEYASILHNHLKTCKNFKKVQLENEKKEREVVVKNEYETKIKELELRYATDIEKIKKDWKFDILSQVKMRDDDIEKKNAKILEYEKENEKLKQMVSDLQNTIQKQNRSHNLGQMKMMDLLHKSIDKHSAVITNNTYSPIQQNIFQLQALEPSVFQGRLNPPDVMVTNVNELGGHVFRLGLSNYYRMSDKSRGNAIWVKPGIGQIKDPKCSALVDFTIDHLIDDIQRQKVYGQSEYERLSKILEPDNERLLKLQEFIGFCNRVCCKDKTVIKSLQQFYVERGKYRTDTSMDKVYDMTYENFISAIKNALLPNISKWVEKTPYELGVFLSESMSEHYHIEGGSLTSLYIVIKDDSTQTHIIHSDKLQTFLIDASLQMFHNDLFCDVIIDLLKHKPTSIAEWIEYFTFPSEEITNDIMKGLIKKTLK